VVAGDAVKRAGRPTEFSVSMLFVGWLFASFRSSVDPGSD
jgi:hypothetical protein